MKHQYYGDVNDYIKYGVLRILARASGLRVGIAWMLTPPGPPTEGGRIAYLSRPDLWKGYDPELFEALRRRVLAGRRNAHWAVCDGLVPGAMYFPPPPSRIGSATDDLWLPAAVDERAAYFLEMAFVLAPADLWFFDPDNGFEVKSAPKGHPLSPKYLYYDEVRAFFRAGHSVMVLQYFPRKPRAAYIAQRAAELKTALPRADIWVFEAANIGLFLIGHPDHRKALRKGVAALRRSPWHPQQFRIHTF
ncbi:MAG: hypothetical protein N2512_14205 [Armatimonadetes bacterium]|nr:hypothetical protein [Armatimonadota bacterium]